VRSNTRPGLIRPSITSGRRSSRGVQTLVTKHTAAVPIGEGHDHELAAPDPVDVAADVLDDPDRLMAYAATAALTVELQVVVWL
jgi:hypothetical protein